jgi:hypothetical protein
MKSRHHPRFPPCPIDIIRRAARQGAEKQRLTESLHVNHQRRFPRQRHIPQPATQPPRRFFVERPEFQLLFLFGDNREIVTEAHSHSRYRTLPIRRRGYWCEAAGRASTPTVLEANSPPGSMGRARRTVRDDKRCLSNWFRPVPSPQPENRAPA